jgi:hypothetical protein
VVRTDRHRKLSVIAAVLTMAIGGVWMFLVSSGEAEAAYSYLGSAEGTEDASEFLSSESQQLRDAVAALVQEVDISIPSASARWIDQSDEYSAFVLTDERAKCLIEETDLGVNAACDTAKNVADHGLYLARFLRESRETDEIIEVVVFAVSPSWATHLWTGGEEGSQPIGAGLHSLRFTGDRVQGIDAVRWEAADLGRTESVGLELPSGLPLSTEG